MSISLKAFAVAVATHVPGFGRIDGKTTGGTCNARYCYAVWMRHLSCLLESGHGGPFQNMIELGPGDSIGTGVAALLSGVERYVALDARPYASAERNLKILNDLVELFNARVAIPDHFEFPKLFPRLPNYGFPESARTWDWKKLLAPDRLRTLRDAIQQADSADDPNAPVRYIAPWSPGKIPSSWADLTLSHTVLQHVTELSDLYQEMSRWTKSGGLISNEIDFKSFGRTREWNGHLTIDDKVWDLLQRRRNNHINRAVHSWHTARAEATGFRILTDFVETRASNLDRTRLAPRFADIDDVDLTIASALIQAVKIDSASW